MPRSAALVVVRTSAEAMAPRKRVLRFMAVRTVIVGPGLLGKRAHLASRILNRIPEVMGSRVEPGMGLAKFSG